MFLKTLFVKLGADNLIASLTHKSSFLRQLIPSPDHYKNQGRNIKRNGISFRVYPSDLSQWFLFSGNTDSPFLVASQWIKPEGLILDIGANVGHFTLPIAHRLQRRVFAFEPNPKVFSLLTKNLALNPSLARHVTLFPVGIGEHSEQKTIAIPRRNSGAGTMMENYDHELHDDFVVDIKPLDDLVNEPVAFIKLDVEGFEYFVFQGARRILSESHPPIYFETHSLQPFQMEIFTLLKGLGYEFLLENGNKFELLDEQQILEGVHNVLAVVK